MHDLENVTGTNSFRVQTYERALQKFAWHSHSTSESVNPMLSDFGRTLSLARRTVISAELPTVLFAGRQWWQRRKNHRERGLLVPCMLTVTFFSLRPSVIAAEKAI